MLFSDQAPIWPMKGPVLQKLGFSASSVTGVSITNPLVLYRSLIATKRIVADPAQHRLALQLQQLYEELKDYEPSIQYGHRLQQISRALGPSGRHTLADESHEAPKPNLFSYLRQRASNDRLAVTRVLTSHEAALEMTSPKGLMLHGEVGTGKSMLIDLFAECLPNRKKRRWHFTTFMLETMARLEQLRRSRLLSLPSAIGSLEDYSLLWLAKDLVDSSPIIFLDEFQLPDRAATKIMTNLMTSFFHLGGVLIATSNRMPEELAKAAGMQFETREFAPRPGSLAARFGAALGRSDSGKSEGMYGGSSEFSRFLEVLRARCEVWEMENGKDYRRQESDVDTSQSKDLSSSTPKNYFVKPAMGPDNDKIWLENFEAAKHAALTAHCEMDSVSKVGQQSVRWESDALQIYGRSVHVPRHRDGVTCWTFEEICCQPYGPADYITMAARYHTFILLDVPILSVLQKNEARRLISLLDALYEARCKLLVSAEAGPDDIFFPDAKGDNSEETVDQDAIYAETIAEVYQDVTAPFRPNITSYTESSTANEVSRFYGRPTQEQTSQEEAANPPDQLEDGPPNTPNASSRGSSNYAKSSTPNPRRRRRRIPGDRRATGPDFQKAGIFTGEDEKFAYKRARSRLWEMCGSKWWSRGADGTLEWWRPLDAAARSWELSHKSSSPATVPRGPELGAEPPSSSQKEGYVGERFVDASKDDVLFNSASPFRVHEKPPPKLGWEYIWGFMKWGKRAGNWGEGVDGVEARRQSKSKIRGWPTGERDVGDHDDIKWENGRQVRYIQQEKGRRAREEAARVGK